MLYAILCYHDEDTVGSWTKEQDAAVMKKLAVVQDKLAKQGRLGPVARLLPTTAATTLRKDDPPLVLDGPYAETKEQLLGFYRRRLQEPRRGARRRARSRRGQSRRRLRDPSRRPLHAGERAAVTDTAWIDAALTSARPQAVGALLRYFRNLDTAEEAFQNACLRALKSWPQNGPPRDPAAWLIMVGRNVAIDDIRRSKKQQPLPEEDAISDLDDAEEQLAERLDGSHYRDDILRLLFICCHPDLPATQQIALALRIVSGLTVKQIARAFLVSEAAMEQRITRAKARVADADVPFETPGAVERSERLTSVAAMIYLIFNEGYSASGDTAEIRSALVRGGDSAGAAVAAAVPERARDHGADRAAADTACARRGALRRRWRGDPARRSGSLAMEQVPHRRGAGADRQGDAPSPQRALPGAGRDRGAACPRRNALRIPTGPRSTCSTARSRSCSRRRW